LETLDSGSSSTDLEPLEADSLSGEEEYYAHRAETCLIMKKVCTAAAGGGRPPWRRRAAAAVPPPLRPARPKPEIAGLFLSLDIF
jgi:hypothetical protein